MLSVTGEKIPLTMTACEVSEGVVTPLTGEQNSIALLINPSGLKLERKICYDNPLPMGDTGTGRKFNQMPPGTLSFSVIFDGTGVVPRAPEATLPANVEGQLDAVNGVIYKFNGQQHEPNILQILWGSTLFVGRLTAFSTDYTLFKPSGDPLRATAALTFESYMSGEEEKLSADSSSPDLSHVVVIREGDTLPLLCHRIYGDSRYYPEIARFNGLRQFRNLAPGLQLHFPPLE
jgi:hypothetical protein